MHLAKQKLEGSPRRDIFKRKHKEMSSSFYASDADLCLVSKYPPGIVACLDYKSPMEDITFAEVILYNWWAEMTHVYIIEGDNPEIGPFSIYRYHGGDFRPDPPNVTKEFVKTVADWEGLEEWEGELRRTYRKSKGWGNGFELRIPRPLPEQTDLNIQTWSR